MLFSVRRVAKIVATHLMTNSSASNIKGLTGEEQHQVYCGLDSAVTLEIHGKIVKQLRPDTQLIYDFERALQAPVLEMMLRGILTDQYEVGRLISIYSKRADRVYSIVQRYSMVMQGTELNPNSPVQLKTFFYEYMNIEPIYIYEKGQKKLSANRDTLEKIAQHRYARPIANAILSYKGLVKKISVLRSGIDSDGRMRFSYNIGGTNTGRFSANKNVFGGGTNANNITDELRKIFVSDEGTKYAYIDLEQAESRVTAYMAGDEAYIDACESADLHVSVAKLIWPELEWSEKVPGLNIPPAEYDKALAEEKFWRHWSRRDMSKRGGHLTNYLGQPAANAKHLNVSMEVMKRFQNIYLSAFKGIRRYHGDIARLLGTKAQIVTPLGRKRLFFGRNYEDTVLRKGVAFGPQSTIGDLLNLGMWMIWAFMPEVDLLTQLYDAVLIQYKDDPNTEAKTIERAIQLLTIPIQVTETRYRDPKTRTMIVPVEASVGWNWAKMKRDGGNPDGLITFRGTDSRTRQVSPSTDLLKRMM